MAEIKDFARMCNAYIDCEGCPFEDALKAIDKAIERWNSRVLHCTKLLV